MSRPSSGRLKELKPQSPVPKHNLNRHKVIPDISAPKTGSPGNNDVITRILCGELEAALHAGKKKAVRLFVSSTFTDTKVERNYLMREVYPQIRQLCQKHGVEFSIVDLRWGIRDTATNDHMTSEICLSEIEKCMTSSLPGAPCFMYLSFNRYGAPPLPRIVPAAEMEPIMSLMKGQEVLKDVGKWYLKDENACPPVYVLQPISTYMPEFLTTQDMARRKELRNEWYRLSDGMMTALREAAMKCTELTDQQKMKWQVSTTHDEVLNGLLRPDIDTDTGLCYIRNIRQFEKLDTVQEKHGNLVWRFIDLDASGKKVDKKIKKTLTELQKSVRKRGISCQQFECDWDPNGIDENKHIGHIKKLADSVRKDLTSRITKAIGNIPKLDACTAEVASHILFCEKKTSTFHGREDLIESALKYFEQTPDTHPLEKKKGSSKPKPDEEEVWNRQLFVVYGISGSGKTSLIAKLVSKTQDRMKSLGKKAVFVTRFCGTTPMSSSSRELIQNMAEQITRAYSSNPESEITDVPKEYPALIEYFHGCLEYATKERPLVIHIDSLDQLSDADNGRRKPSWLPLTFPEHVFVVVSTLPDVGGCLDALKATGIPEYNYLEVPNLTSNDSRTIVEGWLKESKRRLTDEQFKYIQEAALNESEEVPTTLRLRLLFDIASTWTSYQEIPLLPCSVKGLINMIFDHFEKAHGRTVVSCLCGLIGVSRLGLPENDLIDIMSTDDEVLNSVLQYHKPPIPRIPYHVFARLRNDLGDYIIERGAHGRSVLYWYHRQFWETSNERYLSQDKESEDKCASLIAMYYSEEAHKRYPERGLTPQPMYWLDENSACIFNTTMLSELPSAITKGPGEFKFLYRSTLANPVFIAAKCSAGLGRDLVSEYTASTTTVASTATGEEFPSPEDRDLLSKFNEFFSRNVHVLEKEPQLLLQQIQNMSEKPEEFENILEGFEPKNISPWKSENELGVQCNLVNKPIGANPCFMTSSAQEVEGDIYGLDVCGIDDGDGCIVIGSTHKFKDGHRNVDHGAITIHDGTTARFFFSVACDHAVNTLKVIKHNGRSAWLMQAMGDNSDEGFWIVYSSMDRLIRTVHITLGDTPQAFHGVALSLDTEILHPKLSNYSVTMRAPLARNTFAVSMDGRVAASAYGQIASRSQFHYCTKPDYKKRIKRSLQRRYFSSVFKMWNLKDAHESWSANKDTMPAPILEIEPVLAELVKPDTEESEKNSNPEGYYVGAMAFSPDDAYIVMVLLTEDDGETYSPFMSICDSHTMQTVWAVNNVIGFNILSTLDHDLWYWLSCLEDEDGKWFVTFASIRAVTCVAVNSKNPKNVQAKRIWGLWKGAELREAIFCQLKSDVNDKIVRALVTHPKDEMVMRYEPEIDLGDPNQWNEDEQKSELTEFCRKRVFNPYHTKPPESLPPWGESVSLSDLGSQIQRMYILPNSNGVAVTVSKSGEIKVTDLSRYMDYKPPEQHEEAVISCCVTADKKYVCTGTSRGSIGIWNSTTGAMVAIHKKPMPSLTPTSAVAVTSDGQFILSMQSNQIHFFRTKNLVDYDMSSNKKVYDVHDMLMYTSRYRKDSSPTYDLTDDVDVSPDGKLICAPHPLKGNLNIIIGLIKNEKDPPMTLVEVHKKPKGTSFGGNYRAKFSPNGKYLAAYGKAGPYGKYELSDEEWPPQVKLFEMIKWDEWKEVSLYRVVPKVMVQSQKTKLYPEACSAVAFLPVSKHLVSATANGEVKLHTIPDLKVTTSVKAHTDSITGNAHCIL